MVLWLFLIIFKKHPTNSGLKFKNEWTKRLQKLLKNVSLSFTKGKLDEKNEWKFSNQSGEVMYASMYLTKRRNSFFFSVTLQYDFMIANILLKFAKFLKHLFFTEPLLWLLLNNSVQTIARDIIYESLLFSHVEMFLL